MEQKEPEPFSTEKTLQLERGRKEWDTGVGGGGDWGVLSENCSKSAKGGIIVQLPWGLLASFG